MNTENKRALAYISTIEEIRTLEGYDRVEYARTRGWWMVVNKDSNFKVGDKCVYFEVDSKVPETDDRFKFLESRHYKIKTIKICKVYSQGLLLPISLFPELSEMEVGTDVTDILKITYAKEEDNVRKKNVSVEDKYKSMVSRNPKIFRNKIIKKIMRFKLGKKFLFIFFGRKKDKPLMFPTHLPFVNKTDETRVENIPLIVENKDIWIVTEKIDGCSSTYILEKKKNIMGKNTFQFYVLSRNVRQKSIDQKCFHEKNVYWEMAFKYNIEEKLQRYLQENPELTYVCIQGEIAGSVQGNPLKLKNNEYYIYNFITSDTGRISSLEGRKIVEKMGMKWVPIIEENYILPDTMEEIKLQADGKSVINPNIDREGLVYRSPDGKKSFKNVSRKYLLKHE